jgi:hypothetical protein
VQQLHNYFTNHLLLQDFQKVYFTQQSFLDNVFIRNSVLPTKDVIEQTWKANHTTFDYSGITQGINNGYVSYAVTEKTDTSLNMHTDQIPFIKFDEAKWKRGDTIGKYVVYTFVGATN